MAGSVRFVRVHGSFPLIVSADQIAGDSCTGGGEWIPQARSPLLTGVNLAAWRSTNLESHCDTACCSRGMLDISFHTFHRGAMLRPATLSPQNASQ